MEHDNEIWDSDPNDKVDAQPLTVAAAYDRVAGEYDQKFTLARHRAEDDFVIDWVRRNVLHRGMVLDIGCGTGLYLEYVRKAVSSYTGLDVSHEMLRLAQIKFPHHVFVEGDVAKINLGLHSFDVAVSLFGAFSYVRQGDRLKALSSIYDALKPGGRLGLMVYTERYRKRSSYVLAGVDVPRVYYRYADLVSMVQQAGFIVEAVTGLNHVADVLPNGLPQPWYRKALDFDSRHLGVIEPVFWLAVARKPRA